MPTLATTGDTVLGHQAAIAEIQEDVDGIVGTA